jgi:hypothetical protein
MTVVGTESKRRQTIDGFKLLNVNNKTDRKPAHYARGI